MFTKYISTNPNLKTFYEKEFLKIKLSHGKNVWSDRVHKDMTYVSNKQAHTLSQRAVQQFLLLYLDEARNLILHHTFGSRQPKLYVL